MMASSKSAPFNNPSRSTDRYVTWYGVLAERAGVDSELRTAGPAVPTNDEI